MVEKKTAFAVIKFMYQGIRTQNISLNKGIFKKLKLKKSL